MPRRPRHEARHRLHELIRSRRTKKWHYIYRKEWFIRQLRERLDPVERLRRAAREEYEEILRYGEWILQKKWPELLRFIARRIWAGATRRIRDIAKWHEVAADTIALLRGQAEKAWIVYHDIFTPEKVRMEVVGRSLVELPPDIFEHVMNRLMEVAKGAKIKYYDAIQDPDFLRWMDRFIQYYLPDPCKHTNYAIRLHPIHFHIIPGVKVSVYVLRWIRIKNYKADPYIGRSRPSNFSFIPFVYKPDWDVWGALLYLDYVDLNAHEFITVGRDWLGRPTIKYPIRRLVFAPHHIKNLFVRDAGVREMNVSAHHCSAYIKLTRPYPGTAGRNSLLDPRLARRMRRKFIKEATYYRGLRA